MYNVSLSSGPLSINTAAGIILAHGEPHFSGGGGGTGRRGWGEEGQGDGWGRGGGGVGAGRGGGKKRKPQSSLNEVLSALMQAPWARCAMNPTPGSLSAVMVDIHGR